MVPFAFTFAPLAMSSLTMPSLLSAANIKGVVLKLLVAFTFAPLSISSLAISA